MLPSLFNHLSRSKLLSVTLPEDRASLTSPPAMQKPKGGKDSTRILSRYGNILCPRLVTCSPAPRPRPCGGVSNGPPLTSHLPPSGRIEQLQLLSKLEKAGLLSKLEKSGLTLSKIEQSGLLSTAESLGLLSLATDK